MNFTPISLRQTANELALYLIAISLASAFFSKPDRKADQWIAIKGAEARVTKIASAKNGNPNTTTILMPNEPGTPIEGPQAQVEVRAGLIDQDFYQLTKWPVITLLCLFLIHTGSHAWQWYESRADQRTKDLN